MKIKGHLNITNIVVNGTKGSFDFTGEADQDDQPIQTREYIHAQIVPIYTSYHTTPSGRGSGARDIEYYIDNVINTGYWLNPTATGENNIGYWTDRIGKDLEKEGFHK